MRKGDIGARGGGSVAGVEAEVVDGEVRGRGVARVRSAVGVGVAGRRRKEIVDPWRGGGGPERGSRGKRRPRVWKGRDRRRAEDGGAGGAVPLPARASGHRTLYTTVPRITHLMLGSMLSASRPYSTRLHFEASHHQVGTDFFNTHPAQFTSGPQGIDVQLSQL